MISAGSTASAFGEVRQADERHAGGPGVAAPAELSRLARPPDPAPAGPRSDAAVFLRAIEVLEERGWRQGNWRRDDRSVCMLAALGTVNGGQSLRSVDQCRLRDAIGLTQYDSIAHWNDDPARTYEDVILALKRAAHGEAFALDPEPPPGLGSNTAGGSGSNGTANATVHEGTARRSRGAEPSAAAVPQT
jgi:hypothetical protein